MTVHTISHADTVYSGDARRDATVTTFRRAAPEGRRGIERKNVYWVEVGTVSANATEGYCTSAGLSATATTGAFTLDANGTLYATTPYVGYKNSVPCAIKVWGGTATVSSTHGYMVCGRDEDGQPMVEDIVPTGFAAAATAYGKKAFLYVTSITVASGVNAVTGKINFCESNKLGSPVRIADSGKVVGCFLNGAAIPTTGAVTVSNGLAVTATGSATSGDVRGTVYFEDAATGGKYTFGVICAVSDSTALYGVSQSTST